MRWFSVPGVYVNSIYIHHLNQLDQYRIFQASDSCELKRTYVQKQYRRIGIGQQVLDKATAFAKNAGYSRILLDSQKYLDAAWILYLKNNFVDIPRYNDNPNEYLHGKEIALITYHIELRVLRCE